MRDGSDRERIVNKSVSPDTDLNKANTLLSPDQGKAS
jgi:hypothetical protein